MRYVDKHYWIGRVFLSLVVVDLFVCKNDAPDLVYPLFRFDFLSPKRKCAYGMSITIPWVKFTIGCDFASKK